MTRRPIHPGPGDESRGMARRRRIVTAARILALGLVTAAPYGCGTLEVPNPAYPLSNSEVRDELDRLRDAEPAALERPVVILAGYRAIPSMALRLADRLAYLTGAPREQFYAISYTFGSNMDTIAELITARVERRWPSDDPDATIEVDVVGISMGGLIARHAALPQDQRDFTGKRLRIHTLYTLASPHRGALLAERVAPDKAARAMRPGSAFLERLDAALDSADYTLVPYAVLNDDWVGATRTAPPGMDPIWSPGSRFFSHFNVSDDPRVLADLARRLRGEEPLASPSPPPHD